ncbi:MAG: hypothetical protein PHS14_03760 [Elusimicrobia bacterium]|nr:hypothetical protein [Elusimicrobiota bacterium]
MKASILLSLVLAAPSFAASSPKPVRLSGGAKAEDKLRRFVSQDAHLKARLDEAARREEFYVAEARESDLRDAVSDVHSGDNLRAGLEKTAGEKRKDILETLPGMKAPAVPVCRTVAACPTPDLALDVSDAESLPDSMRRLVRPWMVLQQARGSEIELSSIDGPGDAALSVKLKDLDAQPLIINVSPRLLGGFKVWFERPLVLAALYGREREAVLSSAR